mgnify:FL=1
MWSAGLPETPDQDGVKHVLYLQGERNILRHEALALLRLLHSFPSSLLSDKRTSFTLNATAEVARAAKMASFMVDLFFRSRIVHIRRDDVEVGSERMSGLLAKYNVVAPRQHW